MKPVELKLKVFDGKGVLKEERTGKLPSENFLLGKSQALPNDDHLLIGIKAEGVGPGIAISSSSTMRWFREGKIDGSNGKMIEPPVVLVRVSSSLSTRWSREFKIIGPPSGAVQIEGNRAYVLTAKDAVEEINLSDGKTVRTVPLGTPRFQKLIPGTNETPSLSAEDIVSRRLVSASKVIYGDRFFHFYPPVVVGKSDVTTVVGYIGDDYREGSVYLANSGILVVSPQKPPRPPRDQLVYAHIGLYRTDGSRIWEQMLGEYRTTTHWFGIRSDSRGAFPDFYLLERRRTGRTSVNQEWLNSDGYLYLAYETDTNENEHDKHGPLKQYVTKVDIGVGIKWTTRLKIDSSAVTMSVCDHGYNVWIISADGELLRLDWREGKTIIKKNLPLDDVQSLSSSCTAWGELNLFYTSRPKA